MFTPRAWAVRRGPLVCPLALIKVDYHQCKQLQRHNWLLSESDQKSVVDTEIQFPVETVIPTAVRAWASETSVK